MKKILFIQYANPAAFPPIEYISQILAEAGFSIRLLGVHSQRAESMKLPDHSNISVEVASYTPPGWRQKVAYLRFLMRIIFIARKWKPDWVYASDQMVTPAGLLLCRLFGLKVIYHEHDSPVESGHGSIFIRAIMAARTSLAKRAEFIVLPQRERINIFQKETETQRPVMQVWNCPRRQETLCKEERKREDPDPLNVYFHGTLNLDMLPLTLMAGAAQSGVPVHFKFVGYETIGSRGTIDTLRHAVKEANQMVTLELPGSRSRHELPAQMKGMHVGWVNFVNPTHNINLTHLEGASNKVFDYLAAGLPLIVPQDPGWENMFKVPGYAKSCNPNDVKGIASLLRWFYENSDEAAAMGRAGQLRTQGDWNYEAQFQPILKRLLD